MMRDCGSNFGNVTVSAAASASLPQVIVTGDCSYSSAPERSVSVPHTILGHAGARQIMTLARFAWRSRSTPAASNAVDAAAAAAGAARSMAPNACSAAVCVRSRRGRGIGGVCGLVTAVESTASRRCKCALQSMNAAAAAATAAAAAVAAASALSESPNPPATDGGSQQLRMTGRTAA
jgi:hypothetical protein